MCVWEWNTDVCGWCNYMDKHKTYYDIAAAVLDQGGVLRSLNLKVMIVAWELPRPR